MYSYLNPEKALIFRIQHVDNLPWDLKQKALHSRNSGGANPDFVNIGNMDLIDLRSIHHVPVPPGGLLSDYVPFYFTPFSKMMYNIVTGYGGVTKRNNSEIVIFVSSIHHLQNLRLPFVFTNQHALLRDTEFYSDIDKLDKIDWEILQHRDFKTVDLDPGKGQRYQAEALVYQNVPFSAILGVCCFNNDTKTSVEALISASACEIPVHLQPGMYF